MSMDEARGADDEKTAPPSPATSDREPSRLCPNCGAALEERHCKLLCPNRECGYYMSCSEFY